jgi:hypothetical protein
MIKCIPFPAPGEKKILAPSFLHLSLIIIFNPYHPPRSSITRIPPQMASRSRHLLFLTPPSLTRTQPQQQSQAQPYAQPPSHRPKSCPKSQTPNTFFTPSSKQKLEFHTTQNNPNPLQKTIFSTRTGRPGDYVFMGIAFVLLWGICVGIDKSRGEG